MCTKEKTVRIQGKMSNDRKKVLKEKKRKESIENYLYR